MAKQNLNVPSTVLAKLMEDYELNPSKLGAAININQATLRLILQGKGKISCLVALKLAKFFGNTAEYWLNLQNQYELAEAAKDKELTAVLKSIKKVAKPRAAKKTAAKADDAKAKKSGKAAADSKKTTKTAAGKTTATRRTATRKSAVEKAAEPKPTGAKRGRKPKNAAAAPVPEPDPSVAFESDDMLYSEPVFDSDAVFNAESAIDAEAESASDSQREEETPSEGGEAFSSCPFSETVYRQEE
ncbi:MAG: HigA family addiction module antidote protein [Treponema sp.]|jgi:addiction module HigA family antidote|nr:HigA family addiction module antidote protein [Treponema sp.]